MLRFALINMNQHQNPFKKHVSNLPMEIDTHLLFHFLDCDKSFFLAMFVLQQEKVTNQKEIFISSLPVPKREAVSWCKQTCIKFTKVATLTNLEDIVWLGSSVPRRESIQIKATERMKRMWFDVNLSQRHIWIKVSILGGKKFTCKHLVLGCPVWQWKVNIFHGMQIFHQNCCIVKNPIFNLKYFGGQFSTSSDSNPKDYPKTGSSA